jgi:signal transduction histidine kinase
MARAKGKGLDKDERLLASRLKSGFWIVLIVSLLFALVDTLVGAPRLGPLLLVKGVQCGALVAGLVALPFAGRGRELRWLGAAVVTALYVTTAVSAVLRHEIVASSFLYVATAMATASFVPWGALAQLLTAVVAAAALLIDRVLLEEPLDAAFVYRSAALAFALFGSVWVAHEHERQRRERRRAERELAAESRIAAALALAGEEIIRCESTPGMLDRVCDLVVELLGCDHAALVLADPGDNTFVARSLAGTKEPSGEPMRIPRRRLEPLLALLRHDSAVQVETADIADPETRAMHERHGVATSLYVPLRRAGEVIGILSGHARRPGRRFGRAQERIVVGIAHLASLAFENTRLLEELREASRLKSEFVSTMSHELRTPVSVILGYAEMLGEEAVPAERAAMLHRLRRAGLELLELVEETLNLSRLEAGKDPPRCERFELRELFDELVAEFAAMAALEGVRVRWAGPARLDVATDRRKLRIVLKNLLGNALKFTPRGEVVVECAVERDVLRCEVRDTGIGIAPEHLPIIFDMFRQADSSDARAYRGAGLGLHIVQRLVHQLGGEIRVASDVGHGSTFAFSLPMETSAPAYPSPPSAGLPA